MPDQTQVFTPMAANGGGNPERSNSMKQRLRPKLNYSNLIATLALFIALGGAAVAAGLPKHSVGPRQLRRGAVHSIAIAKGAVNSGKLARGSVVAGKLATNSVTSGNLGNGVVTSAKIGASAVIASSIKNGVVTTNKLANEAVTAAKLGKGSVTAVKLGSDVAPLLGTLRSGQTLRGAFDVGDESKAARTGVSFHFPLTNPPAAAETNILAANASNPACPGVKGGGAQTPEAAAGQLCVYITASSAKFSKLAFDSGTVTRLGVGLLGTFTEANEGNFVQGFWAVTAP
jgi:hypothetical protein